MRPEDQRENNILIDGRTWTKETDSHGHGEEWRSDGLVVFVDGKLWGWMRVAARLIDVFGYWATRQGAMRAAAAGHQTPPPPAAKKILVATSNPTVSPVREPEQPDLIQIEMSDDTA
jgi:hypothetical protein